MKNVLKKRYDHFKVAGVQYSVVTPKMYHDHSKVAGDYFFYCLKLIFVFEFGI